VSLWVCCFFFPDAANFLHPSGGNRCAKHWSQRIFLFPISILFSFRAWNFVFGCLLIRGALTPIACVMVGGVMIVAIVTTASQNIKAPPLLGWVSEFLYLPEVLYLVILSWLFLSGPGWFSVDHLLLSYARL
jgi:uncharacterized membrane protein YphA (DoxX/SURF4 family)